LSLKVEPDEKFHEVYWITLEGERRLATRNLTPGRTVYGERLVRFGGVEYRLWNPFRSKLAAAVLNGLRNMPINEGGQILYLGAATGTTPSHVSDIVGAEGSVYCVEFAPRVFRELIVNVCKYRENMFPILADARNPELYSMLVGSVSVVYCDVAQPEQASILAENANMYLEEEGWALLAVKARSIDAAKSLRRIYRMEKETLEKHGFTVEEEVKLEPYDKAHELIVSRRMK